MQTVALVGGYQSAFLLGAWFATLAALLGGGLLRPRPHAASSHEGLPPRAAEES